MKKIICSMAVAFMATGVSFAQTAPTTPASTPVPTNTKPSSATPQQPGKTQGWSHFNDADATRLNLKDDQLQRLQDVDKRYQERYDALGTTPATSPDYAPLTKERNRDVQGILTPEQYNKWFTTTGTAPSKPAGMTGTTTPPAPDN